jgi:hypothetical protein
VTAENGAPDPHEPSAHPVNGLDEVVHQRVRLGILTIDDCLSAPDDDR